MTGILHKVLQPTRILPAHVGRGLVDGLICLYWYLYLVDTSLWEKRKPQVGHYSTSFRVVPVVAVTVLVRPRLQWMKSRGSRVPWWALPAACGAKGGEVRVGSGCPSGSSAGKSVGL